MTEQDANAVENGTESSSEYIMEPEASLEGLTSTVSFVAKEKPEADSESAEQNTPPTVETPPKEEPFHKHPRFKELIDKNNQLAQELEALKKPQERRPNYRNLMDMTDEDLVELVSSKPKEVFSDLAKQLYHEIATALEAQNAERQRTEQAKTIQQRAFETFDKFFADKPDGIDMLQSGKIQQFIDQNPGHNAISAYYALAGNDRMERAVQEAVQKEKDKLFKEIKAKGNAGTLSGSAGKSSNPQKDPRLMQPDKFGGLQNVLLQRHRERLGAS